MKELSPVLEQKENLVNSETIRNAKIILAEYLKLKPGEEVLLIYDFRTRPEMIEILKKAIEGSGAQSQEFEFKGETKSEEIEAAVKGNPLIIDMSVIANEAAKKLYEEYLEKHGSRLACLMDLSPEVFKVGGAMSENLKDLMERLNKIEHVLKKAVGFKIESAYGTDLEIGLRDFKERAWSKVTGAIERSGDWDNLPSGEVFTTPDETKTNGVLMIPAVNSVITRDQGVDELIKLIVKDRIIVSIEGGRSAEILKKQSEDDSAKQTETDSNPLTVYRIAEIAFGANSKARSTVADPQQPYNYPGISFIEAEKRLGTMHLAFGSSQHGTEEADGLESAISHYDFIISRNGLTVEMFNNRNDFKYKKNGRKIISDGNIKFFE